MVWYNLLYSLLPESLLERYWNGAWPQSRIQWDYGKGGYQDVQKALQCDAQDWAAVDNLLATMSPLPTDEDARVRLIVNRLLTRYKQDVPIAYGGDYETDSQLHNVPDYWQSPSETITFGRGDCDDWAILLYACLRRAGIPAYRLKACVTHVSMNSKDAGLHCDLIYLARYDYEWYTLEGSWCPAIAQARFLMMPRKNSKDLYGLLLFAFNETYAWAEHDFDVSPSYRMRTPEAKGG